MNPLIIFSFAILFVFFSGPPIFSAEKDPFARKTEQKAYNDDGDHIGTIKKEAGRFVFYDKDAVILKKVSKGTWKIYTAIENKYAGKLDKAGDSSFRLYNKKNKFLGIVIRIKEKDSKSQKSNHLETNFKDEFQITKTLVTGVNIESEEARLYYYVMEAIQ